MTRKTTKSDGLAGAVIMTLLTAGLTFLLTAVMVTGYFGGFAGPLILLCR